MIMILTPRTFQYPNIGFEFDIVISDNTDFVESLEIKKRNSYLRFIREYL